MKRCADVIRLKINDLKYKYLSSNTTTARITTNFMKLKRTCSEPRSSSKTQKQHDATKN